jgi:Holliday junction resolvase-like predicted endonuclease
MNFEVHYFRKASAEKAMLIAEKYLINKGYKIIRQQWRLRGHAEIDFLIYHPDTLRFYLVEVKGRAYRSGDHFSLITPSQLRRLSHTAWFLSKKWNMHSILIKILWVNTVSLTVELFENPC